MSIGIKCLTSKIDTIRAGTPTVAELTDLAGISGSIDNDNLVVACTACLPSATNNKGRFAWVSNINSFRFSNGIEWTNNFSSTAGVISEDIYAWGSNTSGQIGDATTINRSSPVSIVGGTQCWCRISVSCSHSLGVKYDGTLWTWGSNLCGGLGTGNLTGRSSPGTTAGGGTDWCHVENSWQNSLGIKTDGTLWTWGYNYRGQLGTGGSGSNAHRSSPGTTAGGGTNWCNAAIYSWNGAGVKTDGTLWTWGSQNAGAMGNGINQNTVQGSPATTSGGGTTWCFVRVGCNNNMIAIKTDGTLWTWGRNYRGTNGNGLNTGYQTSPATTTGGGTNWCRASAKAWHVSAVKTDGTLWAWGCNFYGQVGNNAAFNTICNPVTTVGGGTTWVRSETGGGCTEGFTLAVKTDGTLWSWGSNRGSTCGSLGIGSTGYNHRCSPGTVVGGLTDWNLISAAGSASMATRRITKGF